MSDVSVVVVTYNGLPWIEQALESVRGVRDGARRQRVHRRHGRVRPRALSRRRRRRAGEPRPRRRLERGDRADERPLRAACSTPMRGSTTAHSTRSSSFADAHPRAAVVGPRLRNRRRQPAALGARLSDALASRDRVPLPAQARAALARAQRVLRRRVRARRDPGGGVPDGCGVARPARGDRGGRPGGRELLSLQRRGRLGVSLPSGGLDVGLLPGCRRDARVRRVARGAIVHREPARATCGFSRSIAAPTTPSGRACSCASPWGSAACSFAASAAGCTARRLRGSGREASRS